MNWGTFFAILGGPLALGGLFCAWGFMVIQEDRRTARACFIIGIIGLVFFALGVGLQG